MSRAHFEAAVADMATRIAGLPVVPELAQALTALFPPDGPAFQRIASLCRQGVRDDWLCQREQGGIRYGRALKPAPATAGFSIDVVEMTNVAGPFHAHPAGEIDMIMPQDPGARFDGNGEGWLVYGPGSAHHPTVEGGRAIVLYLLPEGAIDFRANP